MHSIPPLPSLLGKLYGDSGWPTRSCGLWLCIREGAIGFRAHPFCSSRLSAFDGVVEIMYCDMLYKTTVIFVGKSVIIPRICECSNCQDHHIDVQD